MNLTLSDWNVKNFSHTDCTDLICPKCLENETFLFQILAERQTVVLMVKSK